MFTESTDATKFTWSAKWFYITWWLKVRVDDELAFITGWINSLTKAVISWYTQYNDILYIFNVKAKRIFFSAFQWLQVEQTQYLANTDALFPVFMYIAKDKAIDGDPK